LENITSPTIRLKRVVGDVVFENVNFSLWKQASRVLKVLIKLFQKFADSKGGALVASAEAKSSLRHFLFA
jgi:hypothetical protein